MTNIKISGFEPEPRPLYAFPKVRGKKFSRKYINQPENQ